MAAAVSTVAMLNAKSMALSSPKISNPKKQSSKTISLLSLHNLPKGLVAAKPAGLAAPAIAGAVFSTLSACDPAFAAQQIAEIAEGDNRGLALLLPIIPAIIWVLYNILQPALNQINRMRSSKSIVVGLGLGGLAATGFVATPQASAVAEMAMIAEAASDNRGQLLLIVVTPALLWVAYNILQPALNQINRMRS